MIKAKAKKSGLPGFSFCNQKQYDVESTYMERQGGKIEELFSTCDYEDTQNWQTVVLQQLIKENSEGFFVTDLERLEKLTSNIYKQVKNGRTELIQYLIQIIRMSLIPFRKLSHGDDVRNFKSIGSFFASLCSLLTLDNPDIRVATAEAIYWFSQNCGPVITKETTTLKDFFPVNDDNAEYSLVPSHLRTKEFLESFHKALSECLSNDISNNTTTSVDNRANIDDEGRNVGAMYQDVLTLCFKSLIELVLRGQANHIPGKFVMLLLEYISEKSEVSVHGKDGAHCSTRVLVYCLLFLNIFIQENESAMEICCANILSLWTLFVDALFLSFKNVQREVRNELLGMIIMCVRSMPKSTLDRELCQRIFELAQSIALFKLDKGHRLSYLSRFVDKSVRINHDKVDIELLYLSQDLIFALKESQDPPHVTKEFIRHQLEFIRDGGDEHINKHKKVFVVHSIQLLISVVCNYDDINAFISSDGRAIILQLLKSEKDMEVIIYALLLSLKLSHVFADKEFLEALMALPNDNEKVTSLVISLLAILMEINRELIPHFAKSNGVVFLQKFFKNLSRVNFNSDNNEVSTEVVVASIDCLRCIASQEFREMSQEFVYLLLDCADRAPPLVRYAFVGLFLDLLKFPSFKRIALTWSSLPTEMGNFKKSGTNIQRTIIRWWIEEERRLGIKYDKNIIIDNDKPLDGHPLIQKDLRAEKSNVKWLLDMNSIPDPDKSYKLDFRSRLYLMLNEFPPLQPDESEPKERIKELMIRSYRELRKGSVWSDIKDQLEAEGIKPLVDDKNKIERKLSKMRQRSYDIQEKQCEIWQQCENDRLALEKRTYAQLAEGLRTAQFVAENYKAIVNSQPVTVSRPLQGKTVKGEDVLVRTGNLRSTTRSDTIHSGREDGDNSQAHLTKEMEENYINDCLKDESISYLVQLMKNSKQHSDVLDSLSNSAVFDEGYDEPSSHEHETANSISN